MLFIIIMVNFYTIFTNVFNETFDKKNIVQDIIYVDKEIKVFNDIPKIQKVNNSTKIISSYTGYITAYGPDCQGCSGKTASGYNIYANSIYYYDQTYGNIRIVAADKSLPFGSIVKIYNLPNDEEIFAIVLDRGSAIGFKKKVYFDLLYSSEKQSNAFGKKKASFDILRLGY